MINSQVKSWVYQGLLEKPSELVLYRDIKDGGLGLLNMKIRALAILIRTFLETCIIPAFKHSLFHSVLFRYHVLGEDINNPGNTPYYDKDFFKTIRLCHSKRDIRTMTIKTWYKSLLDDQVLMNQMDGWNVKRITKPP